MRISNMKKRIIVPILIAILFVVGVLLLRFMFVPWSATQRVNHYLRTIDQAGENVDMVFIGASRTYRGFDPEYFEKELNVKNAINQSTPAQRTGLSYYMLKDMLERYDPEYVVFGATFNGLMYDQGHRNFTIAMDRLSLKNRIKCSTDIFGPVEGLLMLLGKSEYITKSTISDAIDNIYHKIELGRGNLEVATGIRQNGYVGNGKGLPQGGINYSYDKDRIFREADIDAKAYEYFDKITQLCKENNVKLVLTSGTATLARIYSVENYQGVVDFYTEYAERNGIKYFNLNYLKDRETLFPDTVFVDDQHLNCKGGQIESEIFAKILREYFEGKDTDKYFYKDFDDMAKDVHRIAGCTGTSVAEGNNLKIITESVQNKDVIPQYRLIATTSDSWKKNKVTVLNDWGNTKEFLHPIQSLKKYTKLKVEVRAREGDDQPAYMEIDLSKVFNDK